MRGGFVMKYPDGDSEWEKTSPSYNKYCQKALNKGNERLKMQKFYIFKARFNPQSAQAITLCLSSAGLKVSKCVTAPKRSTFSAEDELSLVQTKYKLKV